MLADFPVAIEVAGERWGIICRDVPTAVFFYGFPNSLPTTPCYDGASRQERAREIERLHDWMLRLLPRVAVTPELTDEIVQRLDEGALDAVVGYLHAIGWIGDEDLERQVAMPGAEGRAARRYQQSRGALAEELLPVPVQQAARYASHHLPFAQDLAPNVRLAVREVAKRAHVRPSVLWQGPISDFLLDFRLLIQDESKEPASRGLTPEDAAIGFESYAT